MKRKKKDEEQGADVGAVHVGIGHDDHLVVAQLALVKLLPQAGPQGRCSPGVSLSLPYTLSARAFSTLSILPHRGRMA